MDTVKAKQPVIAVDKKEPPFQNIMERVRSLRLSGLQIKMILPFLVLTLVLAGVWLFVITSLVVDSGQERLYNSMLDASRVANDGIVAQEKVQLDRLRFAIFTNGIAQAMYDQNSDAVYNLIRPILSNSKINLVTVLDKSGREIVTFGRDSNTQEYHRQSGVDFSTVAIVRKVLEGAQDSQGDKFAEVMSMQQGPILFTSAPVRDGSNQLTGVIMVGTYVNDILNDLKQQSLSDIILIDNQGKSIASTSKWQAEDITGLEKIAATLKTSSAKTQQTNVTLNNRPYKVAYSPLIIRNQSVGQIGVIKSSEYLVSQAAQSRTIIVVVFTIGVLLVIIIGYLLAQNIAQPILKLRSMSQAVAAGDLDQRIGLRRADEIGELAGSFDTMTLHLRERTEEAQRLYEETLQRNKELAEINARLEATQLQLIQSEKLASIGQLTAGIVHDVKNPFAVIMGMAEVLADDENVDEETRHGLKVIRESAVKGNTIVSDLLKFARQSKPEMRYRDLRETVQTSMRLTAYLTRKYNTTTDLPETPVMVTYDAQQVEQVLINMIHNAVQAMPERGALWIGLKTVEDTAQVSVQDSGCGISAEHLKRIFDPFFTTKPEGEGTGLGLSVSYGIIANHGGRIDVESEIGKGTTFTIVLPITQQSTEPGEANS